LLRFDLSSIPAGSTVETCTLTLNVSIVHDNSPRTATLHRVQASWSEGTADGGTMGGGGGSLAGTGDVTWLHRDYPATTWTTAGADFVSTASGSVMLDTTGPHSLSTAAMTQDVQAWLNAPGSHHGWILVGDEAAGPGTAKRLDSRTNPAAAGRPRLAVTFTPPSMP
jgi:hypothetical protein